MLREGTGSELPRVSNKHTATRTRRRLETLTDGEIFSTERKYREGHGKEKGGRRPATEVFEVGGRVEWEEEKGGEEAGEGCKCGPATSGWRGTGRPTGGKGQMRVKGGQNRQEGGNGNGKGEIQESF